MLTTVNIGYSVDSTQKYKFLFTFTHLSILTFFFLPFLSLTPSPLLSHQLLSSLHLCPMGSCLCSYPMCGNVNIVRVCGVGCGSVGPACEGVESPWAWRLTDWQANTMERKKVSTGLATNVSIHGLQQLHSFEFSSSHSVLLSLFFRTSSRMGENRRSSIWGLLCWVSDAQYVKASNTTQGHS